MVGGGSPIALFGLSRATQVEQQARLGFLVPQLIPQVLSIAVQDMQGLREPAKPSQEFGDLRFAGFAPLRGTAGAGLVSRFKGEPA